MLYLYNYIYQLIYVYDVLSRFSCVWLFVTHGP